MKKNTKKQLKKINKNMIKNRLIVKPVERRLQTKVIIFQKGNRESYQHPNWLFSIEHQID